MIKVKRFIVSNLENLCIITHKITRYRTSCFFARWSDKLDQRWKTGVWKDVTETEAW